MAFLPCSVSNGDFGTGFLTARHVLEATEPRNRERGERKEVDWEEEYTRGLVRLFLKKKKSPGSVTTRISLGIKLLLAWLEGNSFNLKIWRV